MERTSKSIVVAPEFLAQENSQFDYLKEEFGIRTARNVTSQVTRTIKYVARYPYLGRPSYLSRGVRIVPVNGRNSLVYLTESSRVVVLAMFQHVQGMAY